MADVIIQNVAGDDAPGVVLMAIGPLIGGKRKPPVFRIRYVDKKFMIENKHGTGSFGRWKALGHAVAFQDAINGMNDLNNRELAKHRLRQW
jgi:hypothetical protein